jgi:hypothetical protein
MRPSCRKVFGSFTTFAKQGESRNAVQFLCHSFRTLAIGSGRKGRSHPLHSDNLAPRGDTLTASLPCPSLTHPVTRVLWPVALAKSPLRRKMSPRSNRFPRSARSGSTTCQANFNSSPFTARTGRFRWKSPLMMLESSRRLLLAALLVKANWFDPIFVPVLRRAAAPKSSPLVGEIVRLAGHGPRSWPGNLRTLARQAGRIFL